MQEIETHHPGFLGSQDTYLVGTVKGIGRIYQQTFIDTYSRVGIVKAMPPFFKTLSPSPN